MSLNSSSLLSSILAVFARLMYCLLLYLLLPFVVLRLLWRSRQQAAYKNRISERFAFNPPVFEKKNKQPIIVHAVSVGEAVAASPLIKHLLAADPEQPILITTMTPTGAQQVERSFPQVNEEASMIKHRYLPYDYPDAIARFLKKNNPKALLIMETELWPNLLRACKNKNIPTALVNGRLSEKSANGYQKLSWLTRAMISDLDKILVQTEADKKQFLTLTNETEKVIRCGNIKFDFQLDEQLQQQKKNIQQSIFKNNTKKILLAASTHEGEDEIILDAFLQLKNMHSDLLLLIVPRHPERFDFVFDLTQSKFATQRLSSQLPIDAQTQVVIGDTMGELRALFALCDIALIAGSLVARGGHNMLEAAMWKKPIISGQFVFNFQTMSDELCAQNAMILVDGANQLAQTWRRWLNAPSEAQAMGERGYAYYLNNQGALNKTMQELEGVV